MKKQQKVMYNGIEIFVPVKYDNPRHKITTNIDKKLYEEIRTLKTLTHKDISQIFDCLILTMLNNESFTKDFLNKLLDYWFKINYL